MPNVRDDDEETLEFADESEWMDEPEEAEPEEAEPFCVTCGAGVGIFIGHGDIWRHYRGHGTVASPTELYDAGHAPEVAYRPV